ncbi:MAG: hypothetical protein WAL02_11760 [Rhodoplanes sp.]
MRRLREASLRTKGSIIACAILFADARPAVVDGDGEHVLANVGRDPRFVAIGDRIVDEVRKKPAQGDRIPQHFGLLRRLGELDRHQLVGAAAVLGLACEQRGDFDQFLMVGGRAGPECEERVVEQAAHLVEIVHGLRAFRSIGNEIGAQPEARHIGAKIMGNAANERHARAQQVGNTPGQAVECAGQRADLRRTARQIGNDRRFGAERHCIDRLGKFLDRSRLAAQEIQRDGGDADPENPRPETGRQSENRKAEHAACGNNQRLAVLEADLDLHRPRRYPGQRLERALEKFAGGFDADPYLTVAQRAEVAAQDEIDERRLIPVRLAR